MAVCKACKAEIVFVRTVTGKLTPVDASDMTTPHWATCTSASKFRKPK